MTVIDAFLSTWSRARQTFGDGTPTSGTQVDDSRTLLRLESSLESAVPGTQWSGSAAADYAAANSQQRQALHLFAELDQRLAFQIDQSAEVVVAGRHDLSELRNWFVDAAAAVPAGPTGQRMQLAIAHRGLEQLREIVEQSRAESQSIADSLRGLSDEYRALDNQQLGGTPSAENLSTFHGVDFKSDIPDEPFVPTPPVDPANPFIGDHRFGHWEPVIAPPYTGSTPPPLTRQYRAFPEGTPLKIGGTTGWYTPGRNWAADAPYAQFQEQYRFRIAGVEATTYTRMVHENGRQQQERWVQHIYEYQRNTQMSFSGDVSVRGKDGDLAGLPSPPRIDHEWKPIGPNAIATLSAKNAGITYYLPDGCGGQFTYQGGVPLGGMSGLPPAPPIMTRPR